MKHHPLLFVFAGNHVVVTYKDGEITATLPKWPWCRISAPVTELRDTAKKVLVWCDTLLS